MSTTPQPRGTKRWQNWSGSVHAAPREIATPRGVDDLARLIGQLGRDGRHARVVGSGHSFTPLVQTDDVLLSLDGIQGVTTIDEAAGTATVLGGTKLKLLPLFRAWIAAGLVSGERFTGPWSNVGTPDDLVSVPQQGEARRVVDGMEVLTFRWPVPVTAPATPSAPIPPDLFE